MPSHPIQCWVSHSLIIRAISVLLVASPGSWRTCAQRNSLWVMLCITAAHISFGARGFLRLSRQEERRRTYIYQAKIITQHWRAEARQKSEECECRCPIRKPVTKAKRELT